MSVHWVPDDGEPAQAEETAYSPYQPVGSDPRPRNYSAGSRDYRAENRLPGPPSAASRAPVEATGWRPILWWVCMVVAVVLAVPALAAFWVDVGSEDPWQVLGLSALMLAVFGVAIWGYSARCKTTGKRGVFCDCEWHSQE